MDHTPGLQIATRRASRARLLRFVATCAPDYRWWLGGVLVEADAMPTHSLRSAAFCIADRFWATRRTARFWRNYPRSVPCRALAGSTTVPTLRGAAIDAWLASGRAQPALAAQ